MGQHEMKQCSIWMLRIPEQQGEEQGLEYLFEETININPKWYIFHNLSTWGQLFYYSGV